MPAPAGMARIKEEAGDANRRPFSWRAGGAAGNMRGGRHISYREPTPLANLHLTLLNKVGVPLETFADSSGKVDALFASLSG